MLDINLSLSLVWEMFYLLLLNVEPFEHISIGNTSKIKQYGYCSIDRR